ncbi:hypothetical protein ACIRS1_06035 [Kitasatospora sp. NPDC101176]|uniref:hypothetical protein n=1 Tax=Kitasatospora sp. NPDC101176 TaxID=3364099 RepID=UPI00382D0845
MTWAVLVAGGGAGVLLLDDGAESTPQPAPPATPAVRIPPVRTPSVHAPGDPCSGPDVICAVTVLPAP